VVTRRVEVMVVVVIVIGRVEVVVVVVVVVIGRVEVVIVFSSGHVGWRCSWLWLCCCT
jgi:hypothetical protein